MALDRGEEDRDTLGHSMPLNRMTRKMSGALSAGGSGGGRTGKRRPPPRRNTSLYFNELTTTLMMDGMDDSGMPVPPERGMTYNLVSCR